MSSEVATTYTEAHATYYANHKESIAAKEKEVRRWVNYYEKNKEAIKKRNLERYHKKREEYFKSPEYQAEAKRMDELNTIVNRLTELLPEVMKAPRISKSHKKASKEPLPQREPLPQKEPEPEPVPT